MKLLRWMERAAWIAGFVLLAIYAGARASSEHARLEGIAAFEESLSHKAAAHSPPSSGSAAASTSNRTRSDPVRSDAAITGPNLSGPSEEAATDISGWSAARIAAWKESLSKPETPLAVLRIPAVGLSVPVFDGTTEINLNRGAARIEGTARIGAPGNLGLAAHRDGYFRALKDVRTGDEVQLRTPNELIAYRVVNISIVDPDAVEVLAPSATVSVTLVTCYPFYFVGAAPQRFIVRAERLAAAL